MPYKEFTTYNMTKEEFLQQLHGLDLQDDNLTDVDALALMNLAKQAAKPKCTFLEVGTWKGKSAACLAAVAVKENGKVWCVDHFKGVLGTRGEGVANYTDILAIFKQNMQIINSWQSVVFPIVAPFEEVSNLLPTNYFDFIFIDADNRYASMKFVLQHCWKKLKNRGTICGRNLLYNYTEKRKEVNQEIDKEYSHEYMLHPGIIKAVHDVFKGDYQRVENSTLWYKVKEK